MVNGSQINLKYLAFLFAAKNKVLSASPSNILLRAKNSHKFPFFLHQKCATLNEKNYYFPNDFAFIIDRSFDLTLF